MQKSKTSINEKAIKKISVLDKTPNVWCYKLVHKKGDSYFSFSEFKIKHYMDDVYQAEGLGFKTYTATELINDGNVIENNTVYCSPVVIIHYIDDTANRKYFKTYEEAENYYEKLCEEFGLYEL